MFLLSFPTRERGLKFPAFTVVDIVHEVVPHAGTWIEIKINAIAPANPSKSFPTRERGLKYEFMSS